MGDADRRPFLLLAAYARRRAPACHAQDAQGRHCCSSSQSSSRREGGGGALRQVVPIGFVAYADHVRQSTGINWLGALVATSLVLAASVLANRR